MTSQQLEAKYESCYTKAAKTGKIARVHAGMYVAVVNGKRWTLSQQCEVSGSRWIAERDNGSAYSDIMPSLAALKAYMGIA